MKKIGTVVEEGGQLYVLVPLEDWATRQEVAHEHPPEDGTTPSEPVDLSPPCSVVSIPEGQHGPASMWTALSTLSELPRGRWVSSRELAKRAEVGAGHASAGLHACYRKRWVDRRGPKNRHVYKLLVAVEQA